jgi:hypothetical protein
MFNKKNLFVIILFLLLMTLYTPGFAATGLDDIDWTVYHDVDFYGQTLHALAENYPDIVKVYTIGHSWRERQLWTAEITGTGTDPKTGIYIVGNIHGGENEGAISAMYFAWWLVTNSEDAAVKDILDKYIIYVTPVMNPDGYAASAIYNTRQNLRPRDANGDGKVFSDPYTDTNGDGFISEIYTGAQDSKVEDRVYVGMESPDWDKNGIPGDDPKNSGIDLNRTFDYMWNYLDVDVDPFWVKIYSKELDLMQPVNQKFKLSEFYDLSSCSRCAFFAYREQSVLYPGATLRNRQRITTFSKVLLKK